MTTEKQKRAVRFIEKWCSVKYKGHPECYETMSYFISKHMSQAKENARLDKQSRE